MCIIEAFFCIIIMGCCEDFTALDVRFNCYSLKVDLKNTRRSLKLHFTQSTPGRKAIIWPRVLRAGKRFGPGFPWATLGVASALNRLPVCCYHSLLHY